MASFANFLLELVAVLETFLDGDLTSEIDVLERFEIFAGFSKSFFDRWLRSGFVIGLAVEILSLYGEFGFEQVSQFVSGFLLLHMKKAK